MIITFLLNRSIKRAILFLFLFISITAQPSPKYEVRAAWLTTIGGLDFPHSYAQKERSIEKQKQELRTILDGLRRANVNTVLLQTRIRGTVIYPSRYEPWDGCVSGIPGRSPGYDVLRFAIDECHKRGMEIQAWVVAIPVGKWNSLGCKQLRRKFPKAIVRVGSEGYMNPESSVTAEYISDICEEITRDYDVDGINLDYIRYPETWNRPVNADNGRANITRIVKATHDKVKALKPWVKVSCSPIGKFKDISRYSSRGWNAYDRVMQDAQGWLRSGLMDELFPMMYFCGDQFHPFAIDWAEQCNGRIVAPGLGVYMLSTNENDWKLSTIKSEMSVLRQYNLGHSYFRTQFLLDNTKGIYDFVSNEFDEYPALVPPMKWAYSDSPTPPTSTQKQVRGGKLTLSWQGAKDSSDAPYLLYNVYASHNYPVDVNDNSNLIATRLMGNQVKIDTRLITSDMYFAVTAMDRYGNESSPTQANIQPKRVFPVVELLECNNNTVIIPAECDAPSNGVVAIKTLQNTIIVTRQYQNSVVNVGDIGDGMYSLYIINARGVAHCLGFFRMER